MTSFSFTTGDPSHLTGGANANMTDIGGSLTDLRTFLNGGNLDSTNLAAGPTLIATQQAWQTLAVSGTNWPGGTLSYYKDSLGVVRFRGDLFAAATGTVSVGTAIGTLPAGYRPGTSQYFPAIGNATSVIKITTAGVISIELAITAGVTLAFGAAAFRAEN